MIKKLPLLSILLLLPLCAFANKNNGRVFVADAADTVTSKYIYVDVSNNTKFKEEGALPYIAYTTAAKATVSLELVKDDIYKTAEALPLELFTNTKYSFEIACFEGSYKTDAIKGGIKLQEDYYDYVLLSSFVEETKPTIEGYGIYKERDEKPNPDLTYKHQRIWLSDNVQSSVDYELAVSYIYSNVYHIATMSKVINSYDQKSYYYVDIPFEKNSLHFLRISQKYMIYQDTYIAGISHGCCYYSGAKYADFDNITTKAVDGADYVILGLVVEAYLTYGKADSNGCTEKTIKNLEETWFAKKSATADELKQNKIMDYAGYASNGNSYEGLSKTASYSINEKWNTMKSQAGVRTQTNFFEKLLASQSTFLLVVGGTSVVVVGLVIFLMIFMTKKKRAKYN